MYELDIISITDDGIVTARMIPKEEHMYVDKDGCFEGGELGMSTLVRHLDNGKPLVFKAVVNECPPDCGGAYEDEIEYMAFCPVCDREFDYLDRDRFCRDCGTKLYWGIKWPNFIKE